MTVLASTQCLIQVPGESAPVLLQGVELHAESFAQRQIAYRKTEITSPWVAGSFVTRAVQEEVTEQVSFWVYGANGAPDNPGLDTGWDQFDTRSLQQRLADRLDLLESALNQLSFKMDVRVGDQLYRWDCAVAPYTIQTDQPLMEATMALVKAQIPRSPHVVRTTA